MTSLTAPLDLRTDEPAGRWVLAVTVLGSGLALLDGTAVNVALPAIGRDLGAGLAGLAWTVNGYTLTLAALLLLGGSLGDRLGRRRIFTLGVVWFATASALCAASPTIEALVTARALQGMGAALLTPGSLAILQASFREDQRAVAIGAWSGLGGIAGAVGPFLGGWLTQTLSWRWIFLVNVPVAVVVVLVARARVPESRDPAAAPHTDVAGAALAAVGLGALTYGLLAWPSAGLTSVSVLLPLVAAVVALSGFLLREARAGAPMLPLGVFSSRLFSATNVVTFAVYAALSGIFFWLVLELQVAAGFSPVVAGLALIPVTVVMLAFSPRAGALGARIGPRVPMTLGPLVAATGTLLLLRVGPQASYLRDVLPAVTVFAAGLTLTVAPLTATALAAVPAHHAGLASGVNNAVARVAGLLAIAVLPLVAGAGNPGAGGSAEDAGAVDSAFTVVVLVCAGLLAAGGVLAAAFVRTPQTVGAQAASARPGAAEHPPARPEEHTEEVCRATCPKHYCALESPPLTAPERPT